MTMCNPTLLALHLLCSSCLAVAAQTSAPASAATQPSKPFFARPMLLGAHRGGRALWPENTLIAFTSTNQRWPEAILETDAHLTADGIVVLLHDDSVDRTTNGKGTIGLKTFEEARKLDAGYRFTPDGGKTYPYRDKGVTIPTLEEVLKACPHARFEIELKPVEGVADAVVEIIKKLKAENRVLLASFDPRLTLRARKLAPEIAYCYEFLQGSLMLKELRSDRWPQYRPTAEVLSLTTQLLSAYRFTDSEIRSLKAKGIRVQVHTINTPRQMEKMIDLGMDSLLTDRPDLLAKVLAERKEKR